MKCPVCKIGNVEQGKYDKEYYCDNEFCPSYDETDSSTYNILIRTRKALDIAKDIFNWIDETYRTGQETEAEIWGKVQLAAQEITALEQKE